MNYPKFIHKNIADFDEFREFIQNIEKVNHIGIDLETEGLEWWSSHKIAGIGFGIFESIDRINTWYIPINHSYELTRNYNIDFDLIKSDLKSICQSRIPKIGANIKFDFHFLKKFGLFMRNIHDVQVLARLVRTPYFSVALDKLIALEFKAEHQEWKELIEWCRNKKHRLKVTKSEVEPYAYSKAPVDLVGRYCGRDIYWTLLLFQKFYYDLKKDKALLNLYKNVEQPLIHSVIQMEEAGICVDREYLDITSKKLKEEIDQIEAKIYEINGSRFNINSNKQLKEIFEKRGVHPELRRRKKKDGTREDTLSFDKIVLESVRDKDPLADNILKFRELTKTLNTYIIPFKERSVEFNGRAKIFASLAQESARTGRLSCRQPSLMNLTREE